MHIVPSLTADRKSRTLKLLSGPELDLGLPENSYAGNGAGFVVPFPLRTCAMDVPAATIQHDHNSL